MNRCSHGVYKPEADVIALSCGLCNPTGVPTSENAPQFNRRGALTITATGQLPHCPNCKTAILAVSRGGVCIICGQQFEIVAPVNLRANNKQPGVCPECGSGVHFVHGRNWECADCGHKYKAPKRARL